MFESNDQKAQLSKVNRSLQKKRDRLLRPLLRLLEKIKVSPNLISNTRLVFAVIFFPVFFYDHIYGAVLMATILLLDIVDGSLARYCQTASDRGKFLDMSVDHFVYSVIAISLATFSANIFLLLYNFFIIPIAYVLGTIKKQEFEKSDWIIKPYPRLSYLKVLPVIAFFVASLSTLNPVLINWSLLIPNLLATFLSLYYFIYIQLRWKFKYKK